MDKTIGILGLGYVGLPLAIEFGKQYPTIGYDLSSEKISQYKEGKDATGQISKAFFEASTSLSFTNTVDDLKSACVYVVCVPTPIKQGNVPDLSLLIKATETVASVLKCGDIVVYESTVYPGTTEEVCVPLLESISGTQWKKDFFVAYSPERINPGDTVNTLTEITKVVSGDTEGTLETVAALYASIIPKGVYKSKSIKTAEAAKVIENTQRDLNIALMNELSIIFSKMDINTKDVLDTAATKWNFMRFEPGLVGGHCIGVDPYYLTYKAEMIGYHPEVILAGRRINDSMSKFVAEKTVKLLIKNQQRIKDATVLVLGATFKENCSDIRNSKVFDLVSALKEYGCNVIVHDPIACPDSVQKEYGVRLVPWAELPDKSEAIIMTVPHHEYLEMGLSSVQGLLKTNGVLVDVKRKWSSEKVEDTSITTWQL